MIIYPLNLEHHKTASVESLAYLKALMMTKGIRLSPSIHPSRFQRPFYSVVSNGIELEICSCFVVNAPIKSDSPIMLRQLKDKLEITIHEDQYPAKILPIAASLFSDIPGSSQRVSDYCNISTDRINIWAVESCALALRKKACLFCDVGYEDISYQLQPLDKIKYAVTAVLSDQSLPVRHIQVSGGTPLDKDWDHYISVCKVAVDTGMPVSAMLTPLAPGRVFEALHQIGVDELALNIEFASEMTRKDLTPGKINGGWNRLAAISRPMA